MLAHEGSTEHKTSLFHPFFPHFLANNLGLQVLKMAENEGLHRVLAPEAEVGSIEVGRKKERIHPGREEGITSDTSPEDWRWRRL